MSVNGIKNNKLNKLLHWLLMTIAFHGFPIFRIAGAIKLPEIVSIIISFHFRPKVSLRERFTFLLFMLFVFSPIVSLLYQYLILPYPQHFFDYYGSEANVLKCNYYVWPILQNMFVIVAFVVLLLLYKTDSLYSNIDNILKKIIGIGTVISVYSIACAIINYNPLWLLSDFFQNVGHYRDRSQGFYQEPSMYIVYQSWIVFFTFFCRHLYSFRNWLVILIINFVSLLMTKSTALVAFLGVVALAPFMLTKKISQKISSVIFMTIGLLIFFLSIDSLGLRESYEKILFDKVEKFSISENTDTGSSGAFRKFTSRIGYAIFDMYPVVGVGVGCSIYYMHLFEYKMGIINWGERLKVGHRPQNLYSCVCAEQGLLGIALLLFFLIYVALTLWKNRNSDNYTKMFFCGSIVNMGTMFSNNIIYSMFLWVFIVMGMGYVRYMTLNNTAHL